MDDALHHQPQSPWKSPPIQSATISARTRRRTVTAFPPRTTTPSATARIASRACTIFSSTAASASPSPIHTSTSSITWRGRSTSSSPTSTCSSSPTPAASPRRKGWIGSGTRHIIIQLAQLRRQRPAPHRCVDRLLGVAPAPHPQAVVAHHPDNAHLRLRSPRRPVAHALLALPRHRRRHEALQGQPRRRLYDRGQQHLLPYGG